ncbi:MAG: hypothetical protein IPM83_08240 [Ignavibacteria bacterium]|nr:hypothetical protein [Ignavibacteria bacterium]
MLWHRGNIFDAYFSLHISVLNQRCCWGDVKKWNESLAVHEARTLSDSNNSDNAKRRLEAPSAHYDNSGTDHPQQSSACSMSERVKYA